MPALQTFSFASIIELEKSIANWLKTNIDIEILNISQSVIVTDKEYLQTISLEYTKKIIA